MPRDISGCVLWLRADLGVTLGGTLRATGATPPVLTITGPVTSLIAPPLIGLRIECTLLGARGTWQYRYSADNGSTWIESNVVSAASYPLIGACAGITLAIAAGNAAVDNVWVGTVSAWADQSTAGNNCTQGTAGNQPTVKLADSTVGNRPTVNFTGTQIMSLSLRLAPPCTASMIALTTQAGASYATAGTFGGGVAGTVIYARDSGAQQWGAYHNANVRSGVALTAAKKCVSIVRAYNDVDLRTNGASTTVATGVSGYTQASSVGQGGAGSALEGPLAEMVCYSRALSVAECLKLESYFGARYGL